METQKNENVQRPSLEIQRLYIKSQSFDVPHVPGIFKNQWEPEISLELQVKHEKLEAEHYEIILHIMSTAKLKQQTAFIAKVQQAGLFKIIPLNEEQLNFILLGYVPNQLYPYARKAIADLCVHASFPPITLAPMDFQQLYLQQQSKKEKKEIENNQQTSSLRSLNERAGTV